LSVIKSGSFSFPSNSDRTIITHDLGYWPVFWVFVDQDYFGLGADKYAMSSPGNSQFFNMGKYDLVWSGGTGGYGAGTITGRYYIFNRPIELNFEADKYSSKEITSVKDENYEFAISKEGKDVSSEDYRDFIVHSDTRNMLIHKTGVLSITDPPIDITITHDLGYYPMYSFYGRSVELGVGDDQRYQMLNTATDSISRASTSNITFNAFYLATYAYLIYKDPLL
jgi:hypothetical protein